MEEALIKETIHTLIIDILEGFTFPLDFSLHEEAVEDFISRLEQYVPDLRKQLEIQNQQWGGGSNSLLVDCIFIVAKGTNGFSKKTAERKMQVLQSIRFVSHILGQTKYVNCTLLKEDAMCL